MRFLSHIIGIALLAGFASQAAAQSLPVDGAGGGSPKPTEITADKSLEWYQDQHLYVARDNAKAVRGDLTVEADTLTAHEREKPPAAPGAAPQPQPQATQTPGDIGGGDIDKMTADGNVRITTSRAHVYGDHAVYDTDKHVAFVTGDHLKYETDKETVTAKDSLEYWEDRKLAVARGHAVAIRGDRHVEGDVLLAQFRDEPNGQSQLHTMTAEGHVTVITKSDVSRGDKAVYDVSRNIAILTGNVRITRADGTELAGDVGEVDFATNQSRLMNEGSGRVRALLTPKSTTKAGTTPGATKTASP